MPRTQRLLDKLKALLGDDGADEALGARLQQLVEDEGEEVEVNGFTVDTHLFRELGELLVGRDSTALIELIKNSYDADATEVVVLGENLDEPERGRIVITDNGSGMSPEQFQRGFLRVASRMKDEGDRRSTLFQRRYTGAKGIGRLAAHKLAKLLRVDSIATAPPPALRAAISATIDWDEVENYETLDELADDENGEAVVVHEGLVRPQTETGTILELSRLRRRWTPAERARFFSEVQSFAPPEFLIKPIRKTVVQEKLLFERPLVRLAQTNEQEFKVKLEGEFAGGGDYWRLMEDHASWVIEIHCRPQEKAAFAIAPTRRMLRKFPEAEGLSAELAHPDPQNGPFFDARIFVRVGTLAGRSDQRTWASNSSGVRVFMEGFRVLPYGEPRNDWLKLDSDYTRRSRSLETLKGWGLDVENLGTGGDRDEGLTVFPNNNLFGGVFLVHEHSSTLRALVNREGFVPEAPYDHLVLLVRTGIDLCVRVHAATTYKSRKARREQRLKNRPQSDSTAPAPPSLNRPIRLKETLEEATTAISQTRSRVLAEVGQQNATAITEQIDETLAKLRDQIDETEEMISEQSLLRVLASIGTQMAAFTHEIRALLGTSQAIERALKSLLNDTNFSVKDRRKIASILQATGELRRGLEREASFLVDIVTPDARRRRSRQRFFERFEVAKKLLHHHAERNAIQIENTIPHDLKSPPMFPAELTAVFTNLLSNAVKAAGPGGYIYAKAFEDNGIHVVVQNTGARVDIADSERWFRPFESTNSGVSPTLGQGMGLGLSITRRLLDYYGAEIRFIEPEPNFATAIEFTFPGGDSE